MVIRFCRIHIVRVFFSSILIIQITSTAFAVETIRQRLVFSTGLQTYEAALIRLALAASHAPDSEYKLVSMYNRLSNERSFAELNKGKTLHVMMSPQPVDLQRFSRLSMFELPEKRNLLGFRKLIIRGKDKPVFNSINSANDLMQLKPGQVNDWIETSIYTQAGFQLITAVNYDQLFPMLEKNRFDYIPLGLLEIDQAFDLVKSSFPALTIVEDIYLFYPLKLYVYYFSGNQSTLTRLGEGLQTVFQNGDEEGLFEEKFGDKFKSIGDAARIFILHNPAYDVEENRRLSRHFIEHHGFEQKIIWLNTNSSTSDNRHMQVDRRNYKSICCDLLYP